ncbi:MAG: CopG family transcriptional regulator [Caldilineaceae bacterium]|nr:CopG family transcriptional regulator [Caldilineaceae bacterium]
MKSIQIELPDKRAVEVNALVEEGWFANENEIVHLALAEFVRRYRLALMEQFHRDDIAWALQQKKPAAT